MLDYGFYNMDCMDGMKQFPDKYFDLAIVDPPYGDGGGSGNGKTRADSAEYSTGIARTGFHGKVYPSGRLRADSRMLSPRRKRKEWTAL